MGKDKLRKFRENEEMHNVVQPTMEEAINGLDLKTHWSKKQFGNNQGIVLELGCGKGGILWKWLGDVQKKTILELISKELAYGEGKSATEEGLNTVAFLRTRIDFIENCFGESEIEEIWITFLILNKIQACKAPVDVSRILAQICKASEARRYGKLKM